MTNQSAVEVVAIVAVMRCLQCRGEGTVERYVVDPHAQILDAVLTKVPCESCRGAGTRQTEVSLRDLAERLWAEAPWERR